MAAKEVELKLKVAEAIQDDVNKGIVRVDSSLMNRVKVRPGDIVEIEGDRKTVAIIDRAYPGDIGLNIIRMDGIIRRNAKAGIGDMIKIKKADVKEAKKVVIAPSSKGVMIRASPQIFKQGLLGRALSKGDIVSLGGTKRRRTTMADSPFFEDMFSMLDESLMGFGLGDIKFIVADTNPKGAVVISDLTEVVFNPEAAEVEEEKVLEVTYEDVGGLDEEIRKIREMVELPLKHPELFQRLGIEPPKGVLLHGPPGTGKTLVAKAVANETNSSFFLINGPEIMSKYYGQSEENLRKIFEDAEKNAPSIIFIDEVDAIAPKREEMRGDVERRVVAQLLALMDGLKSRGKVVVIAATNIPNSLDPALRRPGRFDREIEIGVPNVIGRENVLKIHTRNMPLSKDVDLKELAMITHGFVGADLSALSKEAAMVVLRKILPDLKLKEEESIPKELLEKLQISQKDFLEALKFVRPSAMREVLVEKPNVKWDDVGGLEEVKKELVEAVEWPLKHPDVFKRLGIKPPKGILLYGAPGTGKTMLAKAVATETESNFILVKGPELLCLGKDTPVFTDYCGVRAIENFYDNILPISEVVKKTSTIEIMKINEPVYSYAAGIDSSITKTKIISATRIFVKDAYRIINEDSNELEVSANQPLLIFRNDKIEWVKASSLKEGDFIAKPSFIPSFDKKIQLNLPNYPHLRLVKEDDNYYYVKIFSTKEITRLPKFLTRDFAEFLGWFAAEGSVSKEGIAICNADYKFRKRIKKLMAQFVDEKRVRSYEDKIIIYSTPLVKFLETVFEMELGKKKSYTIKMPPIISKSSKDVIAAFLRGAYNGDGHVGKTKVEYSTMSRDLATGIVYLVNLLGIKYKYWKRRDNCHMITISGKLEINKFLNAVYGHNRSLRVRRYYNARYTLPDISRILRCAKNKLNLTYGKQIPEGMFESVISRRKGCGIIRLKRMMGYLERNMTAEFSKSAEFKTLAVLANGALQWTKIKKIEKSEPQWMYDLETEHDSFIGGNIPTFLHNSKWVGESEKAVRDIFKKARQVSPTVICFDEIDALASRRGGHADSRVTESVVNQMLTEMDGLEELTNVVVIATTNRPDMIDYALLRPGRFDRLVLTTVPDEKMRVKIFEVHTKNMPITGDVKVAELAKKTDGYVGGDIEAVCREAAIFALREDMESTKVSKKHFEKALDKVRPSVTKEIEQAYSKIQDTLRVKASSEIKEKPTYFG